MVYVIEKICFDPMENDVFVARFREVVGYCDFEKEAEELLSILNQRTKYKQWDGEYYPKYEIIPVDKIPGGFKG